MPITKCIENSGFKIEPNEQSVIDFLKARIEELEKKAEKAGITVSSSGVKDLEVPPAIKEEVETDSISEINSILGGEVLSLTEEGIVSVNILKSSQAKEEIKKAETSSTSIDKSIQEDYSSVARERIIYLDGFSGGDLKMNFNEKEVHAEVLLPSKFKDKDGNLIDLFEDYSNGKGKYLTKVDGVLRLNPEMAESSLLETFMFRIPTSSHGLTVSAKVVGFLPPEAGDLAITPKNFIAKMGQDFDIDKLTAYQYHHTVEKNGKIVKFNESHKRKELLRLKREIETATREENLSKHANKEGVLIGSSEATRKERSLAQALAVFDSFLKNYLPEEEFLAITQNNRLTLEDKYKKAEQTLDKILAQNDFIEIHNTVLKLQNLDVQQKSNKVLSMDIAEEQAEAIASVQPSSSAVFDILSPNYQMEKMNLGSTGAVAIGIYAKGVTFHSLVQQAKEPVKIFGEKGLIRIGDVISDGTLGHVNSLLPVSATAFETYKVRNIAEVLDEKTNTATDNEKAQILGRVGLNVKEAIAVDSLLSLLGYDLEVKEISSAKYDPENPFHKTEVFNGKQVYYTEHSIPYLLHSQPIVKRMFEEFQGLQSQLGKDPNVDVISYFVGKIEMMELKAKKEGRTFNKVSLTGEVLAQGLEGGVNESLDYKVLRTYVTLLSAAQKLKDIVSIVDMSSLGKSLFETMELKKDFMALGRSFPDFGIAGSEFFKALLGEYSPTPQEGFVKIGTDFYFKPTTNQGKAIGNAFSLHGIFEGIFPYETPDLALGLEEMVEKLHIKNPTAFARTSAKEHIFQEMKKFITSANMHGLFNNSVQARKETFFDTKDNTSLSTYMGNIFSDPSEEITMGSQAIKTNRLLGALEYEKGQGGKPSLIKFNNAEVQDSEVEYLQQAFTQLILEDIPLPDRNGKPYSTRALANDLITYSFSSGGVIQNAIEFHKFIPLNYLEDLKTSKDGTEMSSLEMIRLHHKKVKGWGTKFRKFEAQYFQNNPDKAVKAVRIEKVEGKNRHFRIETNAVTPPIFVAKKLNKTGSKLKGDNWRLYKSVNGADLYQEIPVVGEFGMSEYIYEEYYIAESLVKTPELEPAFSAEMFEEFKQSFKDAKTVPFGLKVGKPMLIQELLAEIGKRDYGKGKNYMNTLATTLAPFMKENTKLEVIDDATKSFSGRSKRENGQEIITLNLAQLKGRGEASIAGTILHEFVHSITVGELNKYYDSTNDKLKPDSPSELKRLENVYKAFQKEIAKRYPKEMAAFKQKMADYKAGNLPNDFKFTPFERNILYAGYNLKEFLAIALGNNTEFIDEAKSMKYSKTNKNILEKFGEIIVNLFNSIQKAQGIETSIATEALYTSLVAVETLNSQMVKMPSKIKKPEGSVFNGRTDAELMADYGISDNYAPSDQEIIDQMGEIQSEGIPKTEC